MCSLLVILKSICPPKSVNQKCLILHMESYEELEFIPSSAFEVTKDQGKTARQSGNYQKAAQ